MDDPVTGARISDLPAAQDIAGTDVLAGVNSSATRKFSLSSIFAWIKNQLTKADVGLSNVENVLQYSASNKPSPSEIGAAPEIKTGSITLSSTWSGSGPYTQTVSVTGVTAASRVDLQPTATQLAALITDGVTALTVENNNGTLTVYALGAAPSAAMTVQYTLMEVSA